MKITHILIYRMAPPYVGDIYSWGAGNIIDTTIASAVAMETKAGIFGCLQNLVDKVNPEEISLGK